MILVFLGVGILLITVAVLVYFYSRNSDNPIVIITGLLGGIMTPVSLIATVVFIGLVSNISVIDDKIIMYEQENVKIETQIAEVVQQYQEYETGIFTEVAPESSVTLVALYPELKADSLVQKQVELYITNNEKIKELKASKISGDVYRWWLYFGG